MSEDVKKNETEKKVNLESTIREILKKELAPVLKEIKEVTLSKAEETLNKVNLLEKKNQVKEIYSGLNGRDDRFHEVLKLNDIDLMKPIEEVKELIAKALDKYPEFRKKAEGFSKEALKKGEDQLVNEEGEIDFLSASRKLGI